MEPESFAERGGERAETRAGERAIRAMIREALSDNVPSAFPVVARRGLGWL
jgi:hypothetical protein